MRYKFFVFSVFFTTFILLIIYIYMYIHQIKLITASEKWIHDIYLYKADISKKIKGKKIIVLSGSNALFSVNSKYMEELTDLNVINLGLHAGLDIDFLYKILSKNIKEGDIVVMPLEFEHYSRDSLYNDWFIENMLNWGNDLYLKDLTLIEFIKFFLHTPSKLVLKRFYLTFIKKQESSLLTIQEIKNDLEKIWQESGENNWNRYSYKSLTSKGDFNIKGSLVTDAINLLEPRLKFDIKISEHFIKSLKKIKILIANKDAQLIITYPLLLKNDKFNLEDIETKQLISNFENKLEKFDINISCPPLNLDRKNFFNGNYHGNFDGSFLFTKHISLCISSIYKKKEYTH